MAKRVMKRVSFSSTQTRFFQQSNPSLPREERKALCWYSRAELAPCREEARFALEALQAVGGRVDLVDHTSHCLRGVEKFTNVVGKMQNQRIFMSSILQQQSTNKPSDGAQEQLALLSRYLSQPSKDLAQFYAFQNTGVRFPTSPTKSTQSNVTSSPATVPPLLVVASDSESSTSDEESTMWKRPLPSHNDNTMQQRNVRRRIQAGL